MKVSIITPSYNQAAFIELTIQSVLGQAYPDLEYIIIDGGSTDRSVDIIKQYEDQLAWWISEPDRGQADAINKGFKKATGDIVAWLNSDDVYAPGAIVSAVEVFKKYPKVGLVYGDAVSFDHDGLPLNALLFDNWDLEELVAFNIICQPAVFIRRDALVAAGYLDESYHFMLDHHLWIRIARLTKILHVPEIWAFARHHSSAKNVAQAAGFGQEALRILDWMQRQEDLAEIIRQNKRTVMGRAHRFNGRYLLDGRQGWPALKAYARSFAAHPKIALEEWHRIVFAGLCLLGLDRWGKLYYQIKKKRLPRAVREMGIQNINHLYNKYGG